MPILRAHARHTTPGHAGSAPGASWTIGAWGKPWMRPLTTPTGSRQTLNQVRRGPRAPTPDRNPARSIGNPDLDRRCPTRRCTVTSAPAPGPCAQSVKTTVKTKVQDHTLHGRACAPTDSPPHSTVTPTAVNAPLVCAAYSCTVLDQLCVASRCSFSSPVRLTSAPPVPHAEVGDALHLLQPREGAAEGEDLILAREERVAHEGLARVGAHLRGTVTSATVRRRREGCTHARSAPGSGRGVRVCVLRGGSPSPCRRPQRWPRASWP